MMSQAAQPGDECKPYSRPTSAEPLRFEAAALIQKDVLCVCVCVCVFRKQSATGHAGAELPVAEAVGAVRKPLYHQGCPSGLSGGLSALSHCKHARLEA